LDRQIIHVNFLDYPSTYETDHRPMQLTLDLRDNIPDISKNTFGYIQRIRSSNIKLVRKYIEHRMKLHKHYQIKEKIQNINNAPSDIRDGNDEAVCLIQKSIQKLDQQNTTICLEAENVLPSLRTTYCLWNIKHILSQMCQLRVEIRKCKRYNNLDNLKSLIK
jgi:hypothetical protein